MLLMKVSQWCLLLILMKGPYLLRADSENRKRFRIKSKLERKYEDLENLYNRVESFTTLYAPDDKRLQGLEVMTHYLRNECNQTSIQEDDGKACLDAVISVVQHMPDFDANGLGDDNIANRSSSHGNITKTEIEEFREDFLNGVGRCNYSITKGERKSLEVSCVEECAPDALFWQGLEDWSSNLTVMLKRLKAERHNELEETCGEYISQIRDEKRKERKRKRKQKKERKNRKRERERQKRKKKKEREKKKRKKEKRKREREARKAAREERRAQRVP